MTARRRRSRRRLRPCGAVTQDLEPLLLELAFDHALQHGEILALVHAYLEIHAPGAREHYTDGGAPVLWYGAQEAYPYDNSVRKRKS
jgi:hypothetical protein